MIYTQRVLYGCILVICFAQLSVALIGDACKNSACPNNEQDAYCAGGICSCRDDRVESDDRTKCLIAATTVGFGCEEEQQCTKKLSEYATCNRTMFQCGCKPDAVSVNGNKWCAKKRFINEPCKYDEECQHVDKAKCDQDSFNNVCVCPQQTHVPASNSSVCLNVAVSWTAPCEESIQCSRVFGDNSVCKSDKKMCGCKEGFHPGSEPSSGLVSPTKTTCIPDRGLTGECTRNDECYLPKDGDNQNIECFSKACRCKGDRVPSEDKQSCNGASTLMALSVFWMIMIVMATKLRG